MPSQGTPLLAPFVLEICRPRPNCDRCVLLVKAPDATCQMERAVDRVLEECHSLPSALDWRKSLLAPSKYRLLAIVRPGTTARQPLLVVQRRYTAVALRAEDK